MYIETQIFKIFIQLQTYEYFKYYNILILYQEYSFLAFNIDSLIVKLLWTLTKFNISLNVQNVQSIRKNIRQKYFCKNMKQIIYYKHLKKY